MLISSCRPTDIRADFIVPVDTTTTTATATAATATATISRKHFTIKLEEASKLLPQQQPQPQTTSSMHKNAADNNLKSRRQQQLQ
ncbi:hypothetical protein ACLKA6_013418 [Drosophila palustris]